MEYDNEKIKDWHNNNFNDLKSEMDALDIRHNPRSPSPKALRNAITKKIRIKNGKIDRLSYRIPVSGIYVHKGVGRGTTIDQAGQGKRKIKRWFSNPTDRNFEDLQDIIAEADATYVLNNLSIK